MEIILYDFTTARGHHSIYFNHVLSTLVANDYKVFVLFSDNSKIEVGQHPAVRILDVMDYRSFRLKLLIGIARYFQLGRILSLIDILTIRRIVYKEKLDDPVIFFPYLDSVLPEINVSIGKRLINYKFSGIYMLPTVNSGRYFGDQFHLKLAREKYLKFSCSCLFLHDSYSAAYADLFGNKHFYTLPELLWLDQSNTVSKKIRDKAKYRYIVGIIGSFVMKKNLLQFLRVAIQLKEEFFFLIYGLWPKNEYSSSEIKEIEENLIEIKDYSWQETDTYIESEKTYNELMDVCDLVWLHHPQHPFSSNTLIKAMAMKKPVLVAPGRIMEEVVTSYKWSAVVADDVDAMMECIHQIKDHFQVPMNEHQKLLENHAPEKFREQILKAVEVCR